MRQLADQLRDKIKTGVVTLGAATDDGKVSLLVVVTKDLTAKIKAGDLIKPMGYEDKLKALGLELPEAPKPVATYVPAVRTGNLLFLSGVLPMRNGQLAFAGKLGRELSVAEGAEAAKVAMLNALAIAKLELGNLDRITRVVKVVGHVVAFPLFLIAEMLVGFVDFFELLFGVLLLVLTGVKIRMILAGQFSVGFFQILVGRRPFDA